MDHRECGGLVMKIVSAALGATLLAFAQPVLATPVVKPPSPTIIYTKGVYGTPTWTTAKVFQDFNDATNGPWYNPGYKPDAGETVTGDVYAVKSGSNGLLEVGPGGTYKVGFTQAVQNLSFNLWSWASSDSVKLTFQNSTSLTLTGAAVFGANGAAMLGTSGNVIFDMAGQAGITSILFSNNGDCDSFVLDNLASAAPEPGTWGMMILGFGLAGAALRRRRRVSVAAA